MAFVILLLVVAQTVTDLNSSVADALADYATVSVVGVHGPDAGATVGEVAEFLGVRLGIDSSKLRRSAAIVLRYARA